MKKWTYLVSGILIGAVVATSGSAAAAQIKSMIGQKVTGELTVVVNGKELPSKGAVINGTTNAPVRALVDAVGGSLVLEGKVITITTNETETPSNDLTDNNNLKKSLLLSQKASLESDLLQLQEAVKEEEKKLEQASPGAEKSVHEQALEIAAKKISDIQEELNKINAELEALK